MRALAVAVAAVVLAGCSSSPAEDCDPCPGDLPQDGITGVVIDGLFNPVAGATVRVIGGAETTSDERGAFAFGSLDPGEYILEASKPGYATGQTVVTVAGEATLPVKIRLQRNTEAPPYVETIPFDGFYECAFTAVFITDSCDFVVRTASDAENETVGTGVLPRGVQNNQNTLYIDVPPSVVTIVQEGHWESGASEMMILLSSTPIDNACDCSERDYLEVVGASPTYGRLDGEQVPVGERVAVRAFLPFAADHALNQPFTVYTTFFHHAPAPEGWSFVAGSPEPF